LQRQAIEALALVQPIHKRRDFGVRHCGKVAITLLRLPWKPLRDRPRSWL
jgi:hypothetical protein